MYTSKLKLTLHWLLFTVGFYLFWGLSYLVMAKFALNEVNRFRYAKGSILSQITASDIFWYAMFIFGMGVIIFVMRKFVQYSPNRKIAVILYATLIIVSAGILVNKLAEDSTALEILPHVVINLAYVAGFGTMFFKQEPLLTEEEEDTDLTD